MIHLDLRWSHDQSQKVSYLISDLEIVPNLKHTFFIIKQHFVLNFTKS